MRRLAPTALLALALAGCGGSPTPTAPAAPATGTPARVVPGDIRDVAVLADGALVLADRSGDRLIRRAPDGTLTEWADVPSPRDLAHGPDGALYVAASSRVFRVGTDGATTEVAELAAETLAVGTGADGTLYACEDGLKVFRVDPAGGTLTPVAGSGERGYGGDGGPALAAALDQPHGLLPLPDGRLLLADSSNHRIREVRAGVIRTVAGTGRDADLNLPSALSVTADGTVLVAGFGDGLIRSVGAGGKLTTYAEVDAPGGMDLAPDGTLYVTSLTTRGLYRVEPGSRAVTEVPLR